MAEDNFVLLLTLQVAVPQHISRIRDWPYEQRAAYAEGAVDVIASQGDVLMYGGRRGEAANAFNQLARALAVLACQPGGVTYSKIHWCAWPHPRCPSSRSRPPCCSCPAGCEGCTSCSWCRNGCARAAGEACCTAGRPGVTPAPMGNAITTP